MKRPREVVEKQGFQLSDNENGNKRQSKMIASCGFLEEELRQCRKKRSRLENQSQELGSERKSEKKEVQIEILADQ